MKTVTDISRFLFFLASLIAIVAATKVSAAESSSKLFDAAKWLEQQKNMNTKQVSALTNLVTIQYDQNINRPWEPTDFKQQKTLRWKAFRDAFCINESAQNDLCLLSEDAELSSISNVLKQESTLKQINQQLKNLGSPVSIVRLKNVPAILPEDMLFLNDFNFIIGVVTKEKSPEGRPYYRIADTLLMDIGSYFLGFHRQPPAVYLAMDRKNQALIFEETLIAKALELAPTWQKALVNEAPDEFLYSPNRLIKEYTETKKGTSQRYQGLKTIDGIEWLIYDEIKAIAINQAIYMQNSWDEEMDGLKKELAVRGALLQLQKDFDMRLVALLFLQHSFDQNAVVIQQYTPPSTVNTVMRENINVMLSAEGFKPLAYKAEWMRDVNLNYIQDESYLKEFNLDLYEALDRINVLYKDWTTLSGAQKRSIVIAAVYPKNMGYADEVKNLDNLIRTSNVDGTYINKSGMYRIFSTLALSKDLSLFSRLADEIYDKRFAGI